MHELPTSFGKYYLTEKIATGGMAEIYLAKLLGPGGFEKQLVLKQIHPELSGQRAFVDLFVAEAKTLVSLGHGNIVPIYELGMVDDVYFIAMEYVDGVTLRDLGNALHKVDRTVPPAMAAYIIAQILGGLDYAHRKGVVHRDMSPRNVMLSRDGEVKLLDFGIAVEAGHVQSSKNPVGSLPYMSPEQVRGQPLTPQSDLFASGVLLWESLTGADLFARPDADDTLRAVTDATIEAPSALNPEAPGVLDDICLRALARDPAARYATAADFLAGLNRYLYALEDLVTPPALARMVARHCPPIVKRPDDDTPTTRAGDLARGPATRSSAQRSPDSSPDSSPGSPGSDSDPWSPESTRPMAHRLGDRPGTVPLERTPATTGRHGTVRMARQDRGTAGDAGSESAAAATRTTGRHGTVPFDRGQTAAAVGDDSPVGAARPGTVPQERPTATSNGRARTAAGKAGDGVLPDRRHRRRASTIQTFATAAEFERVLSATQTEPDTDTDASDRTSDDAAHASHAAPGAATAAPVTGDDPSASDRTRDAAARNGDAITGVKALHDATSPPAPPRRQERARRASTLRDMSEDSDAPLSSVVSLPSAPRTTSWARIAVLIAVLFLGIGVGAIIAHRAATNGNATPPAGSMAGTDQGTTASASSAPGATEDRDIAASATDGDAGPGGGAEDAPDRDPTTPRNRQKKGPGDEATSGGSGKASDGRSTTARRTGTLKVGANPWGEVYLDGRKLGRAPGSWSVPSGSHKVEVVFPVAGRKQKRRFSIKVEPNRTTSLGVVHFSDDL